MATDLRSMLASEWALDVEDPASPGTWLPVKGLTSFTESSDDNLEDDSDFDSGGHGSDVVTQRKWSLECEGKRKRTTDTSYVPDPGQDVIFKARRKVGFEATVKVRWYRRDGAPDAYEGRGSVTEFELGGETTDLEPFTFTIAAQGEAVEITNPSGA